MSSTKKKLIWKQVNVVADIKNPLKRMMVTIIYFYLSHYRFPYLKNETVLEKISFNHHYCLLEEKDENID